MSQERFLWNKDRTEMVRVGAIKQIAIAEIGASYPTAPADRVPRKKPAAPEKTTWVVRCHFARSTDTMVLGVFDTLAEARQFVEGLQRHAEAREEPQPSPVPGGNAAVS
ncbi:MAG: hypothetical protein FJ020_05250 [Chloroflexi bacterium]|nr:hypothetical protein [Chloroflexota bacterium]